MSWMQKLYETYQEGTQLDLPYNEQLMPISHAQLNAHINIVIDGDGNFQRANVLEKTSIILQATEKSAGRTSGEAPYPLADKLQYVAKDYAKYGGLKKDYFKSYQTQLLAWCQSKYAHNKALAVYQYITKGRVIEDLINAKIIYIGDDLKMLTHWDNEAKDDNAIPLLFKILPQNKGKIDQGSALICWTIEVEGDPNSDSWTDLSLQKCWIAFESASSSNATEGFCYVTGNWARLALNHPSKIRHSGDKAKLISSNDMDGYTYRGKFLSDEQAVGISFDVTQKAHNALRWLLHRQGYPNGDQRIVAWAISGKAIPQFLMDSYRAFDLEEEIEAINLNHEGVSDISLIEHSHDLGQSYALKLNKKMAGYRSNLDDFERIMIMALDSATPGRLSIIYYRECFAQEFMDLIESWHYDFAWQQRHTSPQINSKKTISKVIWPVSAPSPYLIAEVAYGKSLTDSLKKNLYERILPCILEGRSLPIDILNICIHQASNCGIGESWERERNLGVACALYRGFYRRHPINAKRRDYSMTLEINNTSRDYLYGRLLAVAEQIEKLALNIAGEHRITTAERLMQRFADRPYSTWRNIELALRPYMQRLQTSRGGFLTNRLKDIDNIMVAFDTDDFTSDKKLSGEFLLAYHCQRQAAHNKLNIEEN